MRGPAAVLLFVAWSFAGAPACQAAKVSSGFLRNEGMFLRPMNISKSVVSMIKQEIQYELRVHEDQKPADKIVLSVIVAMGWGMCGVDRCFLGQVGLGVAKGLTCGGLFIWAIIDFFVLAYNIIARKPDIDVLGFKATFKEGTVQNALWVFIIVWAVNVVLQIMSKRLQPKSEATAFARRQTGNSIVGPPTQDEVKALFNKFDKDGNGVLDQEEIKEALKYLGIPEDKIASYAAIIDTDSDGKIDVSEFSEAFEKQLLKENKDVA
jgi:hypothetical protein